MAWCRDVVVGGGRQWGAGGGRPRGGRGQVSQAAVPIVTERMATAVTYRMKKDIRRRHSLSIGACGRSCSADKHLKAVEEREP